MTLRRNRADRIHARRLGALARIDNGSRREDTSERIAATNAELCALLDRTMKVPTVNVIAKVQATGSEARKAHRKGRLTA